MALRGTTKPGARDKWAQPRRYAQAGRTPEEQARIAVLVDKYAAQIARGDRIAFDTDDRVTDGK